jgi:hypothetical protein
MSKTKLAVFAILLSVIFSPVQAQDPVEMVMEGCGPEIENFCSQVTLGEGRLMACFFAHEDKLSGQCQHALYDAAVLLDQAINALVYVATNCEADIDEYCMDVEAGEGRILNCLLSKGDELSESCSQAMQDVEE